MTSDTTTGLDPDTDLGTLLDSCICTAESRYEDWDTLAFQTKAGEQYRRSQIRYIGSGATGDHSADSRTLPAEHFTFSNMRLPVGAVGPEHVHHDVEEVFYVLEGTLRVRLHNGEQVAERDLGYRDLIRVPPGLARSLENVGDSDALFCVIIGTGKPQLPTYPETSPMHGITRD